MPCKSNADKPLGPPDEVVIIMITSYIIIAIIIRLSLRLLLGINDRVTSNAQNAGIFQAHMHCTNFANKSNFKKTGVHQPIAGMHLITSQCMLGIAQDYNYKDCATTAIAVNRTPWAVGLT